MDSLNQPLLDVAIAVAGEAAHLARRMRTEATRQVSTKSTETDVVTAADKACERLIRDRLAVARPGEEILGEEEGGAAPGPGVSWVVDPIDGTVNYLYGYPWYAVSVGAWRDGIPVAAAVVEPITGRTWSAVAGWGAWCGGRVLRASAVDRLAVSMLATGFHYDPARRARQSAMLSGLLPRVRDIRRSGASSLDFCAVAAGLVDAYVEHGISVWDWAAGALIAKEAGAVVRVPHGHPWHTPADGLGPDAAFASAPDIADDLRELLIDNGCATV